MILLVMLRAHAWFEFEMIDMKGQKVKSCKLLYVTFILL
jgi:hypothetical protein